MGEQALVRSCRTAALGMKPGQASAIDLRGLALPAPALITTKTPAPLLREEIDD